MVKHTPVLVVLYLLLSALVSRAGGPSLEFIENRNQWDRDIDYGVRIPGGMLFLDATGFHYYVYDQQRLEERHMASHAHADERSEEHTSELQSREKLVCRLLL